MRTLILTPTAPQVPTPSFDEAVATCHVSALPFPRVR